MSRGRKMLIAQRMNARHHLPPLGAPPKHLKRKEVRAWHDVVAAAPDLLRAQDQYSVGHAAVELARWRSGDREPGSLRLAYRLLGDCFIPMRERRRLLFPERQQR